MAKRPYTQRLRAEAAEENRRRILDALYARVAESPAEPITVDEVARRAGVARSTIYLVFASRSGLFDALTEHVLIGSGYARIVEAVRHEDARQALRGALAGGVEMFTTHHEVLRTLQAMAKLDPAGVGQALGRVDDERSRGVARLAKRLRKEGHLRADVNVDRASALLWLLGGFDAYDALASGHGLAPAQITDLLVETAEQALLVAT